MQKDGTPASKGLAGHRRLFSCKPLGWGTSTEDYLQGSDTQMFMLEDILGG